MTLAVPQCIATVCRTHLLEIPGVGLPCNDDGTFSVEAKTDIVRMAKERDCVMAGPARRATAGSGDVVGGGVAAVVSRGLADEELLPLLCAMAVETHAVAGSLAAEQHGLRGVMAGVLVDVLGQAVDAFEARASLAATEDDGAEAAPA